jgi:PAS domain S-box-containing protein
MTSVSKIELKKGESALTVLSNDEKEPKERADRTRAKKNYIWLKYIVSIFAGELVILCVSFLCYRLKLLSSEFLIDNQGAFAILFAASIFTILAFIILSFKKIRDLEKQVLRGQQLEEALLDYQAGLESRFRDRTSEVTKMNEELQNKTREHKLALEALAQSENKYREFFDKAIQPMFQSSVDGTLLAANPAFLKLLGYSSLNEFQGISVASLYVDPSDRETYVEMMKIKGYCHIELELKRKDGKQISVMEHARTIYDASNVPLIYEGVLEDFTFEKAIWKNMNESASALKLSEGALTRLNARKNKTMSILSHDLRSPFSSILGFCEILLDDQESLEPQERREFISYIKESAEHLLKLVNDLLDLTRMESGKTSLNMSAIELSDVVQKCMRTYLGLSSQKNIALISSVPAGLIIRGDEQKLLQVFNNLISNSLKFTPAGGDIVLNASSDSSNVYTIIIRDTGIGIPEKDIPKLMKVEEKYTRKGLGGEIGTGLGLTLAREIMKKHKGDIRIESVEGKGTTIYLEFPIPSKKELTKPTILIVDNEKGVRALHARYVKRIIPDAQVLEAGDGMEALQLALEFHPTLIISDFAMPQMDGRQLIKSLRQDSRTRNIPVLIITGHGTDGIVEILKNAGAVDVLMKPLNAEGFEVNLRKCLESEACIS